MAGGQDLFDAIVMADNRWVPVLSGPLPVTGVQWPLGPGVPRAWASEECSVALEAAGTCEAELLSILLSSSAAGAGRAPRAQLRLQTRLRAGAAPGICSVC